MKKLLSLLMLALISIGTAWADTEKSGNTGTDKTTWNGTSMALDGKYIAGKGAVQQGDMPDKGVKLRSNQGNLVFTVNAGFKVTSFKFYAAGNTPTTVDIESVTVDDGENLISTTITIPGKGESTSANIALTDIEATKNITITFASGSSAQIVGTWEIEYIQEEVIVQEITAVTLNGSAISDTDLATLISDKAITIDGSELNGLGALEVTLSSGATTVTRTVTGSDAAYKFTINSSDEYTVNVTNASKTYAAEVGSVVFYSKDDTKVDGANSNTVTANGIIFKMVDTSKTFQYGSGSVTLGETKYVPLKLSTGCAVNVTFPEGKVATKAIVYGWSVNGNGKLTTIKESDAEDAKSVDSSADIFYATNTAADIYPSVYEYDLDNWESFYFTAAGSASQPFVVIEFVFAEVSAATVLANIAALKAYEPEGDEAENVVLTLTDAKVTYVGTKKSTDWETEEETDVDVVVFEDETGGIMWQGSGLGELVSAGQVLNGKLALSIESVWGDISAKLTNGIEGVEVTDGDVTPLALNEENILEYSSNPDWHLVELANVTFKTVSDESGDEIHLVSDLLDEIGLMDALGIDFKGLIDGITMGDTCIVTGYVYSMYGGYITAFQPISITKTIAVTVGTTGYATFSSDKAVDFTESSIKAYTAIVNTTESGKEITFKRINKVPANTGVLLYAAGGAKETVPVISEATLEGENELVASTGESIVGQYILYEVDGKVGFFKAGAQATLAAGKAYLPATVANDARAIILPGGEVTAISNIEVAKNTAVIYNMNGQRVQAPVKGLNIVNGKKVMVK